MAIQINATLFADPIEELLDILPDIGTALGKLGTVEQGLDNQMARLGTVEQGIEVEKNRISSISSDIDNNVKPKVNNLVDDVADIKPKTSKILNWLGTALDTLDIVGFVLDLAQTAALTAMIMEVGSNSLARDEELGIRIDDLRAMIEQYLQSLLNGQSTLLERTLLLSIILDKNDDILSSLGSLSSNVSSVKNRIDSYQDYIELLDDIDSRTIDTLTEIKDIIPAIKPQLCLALQDCPPPALSSILEQIASVRSILGNGNLSCGDVFFASNISHGLESIYCGLRSNDIEIEFPDVNLDLSPVLTAIQGIDSKLGLPHICDDLGSTIQTIGQGLCLVANQNPEDFHVAPFDHEERLVAGSFLVLKLMDSSLENYPFRKSRDTYYPYQLPNPRADLNIADIAGIRLNKGNVYCWVNDLTRTDGQKIFKASFEDADIGYSQLAYLFSLTNYGQPEYGHSSRSIPGNQLARSLRVCSAAIISDGNIIKKFTSRDMESYLDNL
jgi:hypothetical protein